jgi:hypothetical protein
MLGNSLQLRLSQKRAAWKKIGLFGKRRATG